MEVASVGRRAESKNNNCYEPEKTCCNLLHAQDSREVPHARQYLPFPYASATFNTESRWQPTLLRAALVDSADWVADHERNLCYVCTRPFGTFRRKHHCRMCGEVVCKNCTLYKDAHVDPTIGTAAVRVCMSCVINNPNRRSGGSLSAASQHLSVTSEASRVWLQNHLHSPASGPSSEPDSEELQLRSLTPKPHQHLEFKEGHFNAEGESRNTRKRSQDEQHSNEPSSEWAHPWPRPPVSADEGDRLRALHALKVLDSESETPFDMICDLAKARLSCPMAAVSFLDEHRQWFKASVGLAHKMIRARSHSALTQCIFASRWSCWTRFRMIGSGKPARLGVFVLDTRPREACDISILERLALAAGENLPAIATTTVGSANQLNTEDNKVEKPQDSSKADEGADAVHDAAQDELQSFGRRKIGVPVSPSTSTTASSMSSFGSSSMQVSLSPSKLDNNDGAHEEDTSMAMTQLSMGTTAAGEQMEVLLMRLLTQNTETQQQWRCSRFRFLPS
ncbi:Zinc finger, FYVE-related [Phytophthora cactorum]|nr:Zinc finger, FYVE-related [Phytophthora cactorum]